MMKCAYRHCCTCRYSIYKCDCEWRGFHLSCRRYPEHVRREPGDWCGEWNQKEGWQQEERQSDSWERLAEDACKSAWEYWECEGSLCKECPAVVDGKNPHERYGCTYCRDAKTLDLLARAKRLAGVSE